MVTLAGFWTLTSILQINSACSVRQVGGGKSQIRTQLCGFSIKWRAGEGCVISLFSTYISTQPFRHKRNFILSFHHRQSAKFMFCISLRHIQVYFPFSSSPAHNWLHQKHLNILPSAGITEKKNDYVLGCCHLNVNLDVTSEMYTLNSCAIQCCWIHNAMMVTAEVVRSTLTRGGVCFHRVS